MQSPRLRLASPRLWVPLALGLGLRAVLLGAAGELVPVYDEISYLKSGSALAARGTYSGVWPPGYPAAVALALQLGGTGGIFALRVFQVLCSLVIGYGIVLMAQRLFDGRAARFSAYAWALYLPLGFYTHRLWPETLFLALFVPALYLLLDHVLAHPPLRRSAWLLASAGLLYGMSLYLKESPTYLVFGLAGLLVFAKPHGGLRAALFVAVVGLTLTPLMARNYQHYDRFVVSGASLGQNVRYGLSAAYVNHDYNSDPGLVRRVHLDEHGQWDFVSRTFIAYGTLSSGRRRGQGWPQSGPGWQPSEAPNRIDRNREDLASGLSYALEHKAAFVRTRVKKLADLLTPLSLLVRDLTPEVYGGPLASAPARRLLISLSLLSVVALLPLAWIGLVRLRTSPRAFAFFAVVIGYFALTAGLVAMSRFRIPAVPLALVLVGSALRAPAPGESLRTTWIASGAGIAILALLWLINLEEVGAVVGRSWG